MKSVLQMPEFKVGLLVLVVAALIAVMSMRVSEDPTLGGAKKYWFLSPNASGLVKKSAIKMAGIPIGVIKDIRLSEGIARIDIVVRDAVDLRQSARVEIKASGILGDKYVELYPGSPEDPPLGNGEQIMNVNDKASLDGLLSQVTDIGASLKTVAITLKESVQDEGSDKHILGRIIKNIDRLTGDLASITHDNKERVTEILSEINAVTKSLNSVVNKNEGGLKQSWARLDKILKNVEEVTAKINDGKGSLGKLINDEKTVDEINTAVEGINNMLDASNKLVTSIDFHSEFMGSQDLWRSYIGLKLQPGPDRYYFLQVIDDPNGLKERTRADIESNPGANVTVKETKTSYNKMKLTLLFAKNFYDFTIRGGMIENSGGVGLDYQFYSNRFKLSAEAFQFTNLNMRYSLTYNFLRGFYVMGGVHDAFNNSGLNSNFVGAGLFLTNDDMKYLLTRINF